MIHINNQDVPESMYVKRVDRTLIRKGAVVNIYEDQVQLPDGKLAKWDFIEHQGAAAIVAAREDGKILVVRQYRNAIEKYTYELPAGCRNKGEELKTCAIRELEEETGYAAKDAKPLFEIFTTVAFCNEKIGLFYANQLTKTKQHLDEGEYVNVEAYSLDELTQMILDGKIQDSKTIAGILGYQALLRQE